MSAPPKAHFLDWTHARRFDDADVPGLAAGGPLGEFAGDEDVEGELFGEEALFVGVLGDLREEGCGELGVFGSKGGAWRSGGGVGAVELDVAGCDYVDVEAVGPVV